MSTITGLSFDLLAWVALIYQRRLVSKADLALVYTFLRLAAWCMGPTKSI